ncbi:MAG TPA: hypothetical protein VFX85_02355 [Solirubrobacterales bacterium]|nr:hypothetical protein [Solirubrobacterales bacterium]
MSERGAGRRDGEDEGFLARWRGHEAEYLDCLRAAVASAEGDWRESLRAAAWESVRWAEADPAAARFLTVDALAMGERGQVCQRRLTARLMGMLEGWLRESEVTPPPGLARWVLGLFYASFHRHLAVGDVERLADVVPQLLFLAVSPVCGVEAALAELETGPPQSPGRFHP